MVGVGRALSGRQAAKHHQVVLAGVVVVRGQLVVDQVRDMQVHQLQAAQVLQHRLHRVLAHFKLPPRAGQPDKALGRQRDLVQIIGQVQLGHGVGQDVKDAHGRRAGFSANFE